MRPPTSTRAPGMRCRCRAGRPRAATPRAALSYTSARELPGNHRHDLGRNRLQPPADSDTSRQHSRIMQHAHKLRREQLAEPLRHRQECAQTAAEADGGTRPRVIRPTGTACAAVLAFGVRRPRAARSVRVRRPPVWGQVCSSNRSRCAHACGIAARRAGQPAFTIPQGEPDPSVEAGKAQSSTASAAGSGKGWRNPARSLRVAGYWADA